MDAYPTFRELKIVVDHGKADAPDISASNKTTANFSPPYLIDIL